MRNPFTIGPKIQNPEEFVGRTAELNHIIARLRKKESSSVVGDRRIGKSSLLYHLCQTGMARIGDESFRFLYIELTDASTHNVVDFLRTILAALNCSTDGVKDENKPNRNLMAFDREIKTLADNGESVVLCLDEFEGLFEHPTEFNNGFFNHLRSMLNGRRLALITATCETLETYGQEKRLSSPFFNLLSVIRLGDFTEEEAVQFLALYHPQANFTETELRFITSWLDPHPLKLQILCDQVLQNREWQWRDDVLRDEVEKVYRESLGERGVKKKWIQFKSNITLDFLTKTLASLKIARDLFAGK